MYPHFTFCLPPLRETVSKQLRLEKRNIHLFSHVRLGIILNQQREEDVICGDVFFCHGPKIWGVRSHHEVLSPCSLYITDNPMFCPFLGKSLKIKQYALIRLNNDTTVCAPTRFLRLFVSQLPFVLKPQTDHQQL